MRHGGWWVEERETMLKSYIAFDFLRLIVTDESKFIKPLSKSCISNQIQLSLFKNIGILIKILCLLLSFFLLKTIKVET